MLNYGYYTAADADRSDISKDYQGYTKKRTSNDCGAVYDHHLKVHVKVIG